MYGYVAINKPELRIREYDEYRSYYCGLCRALKKASGAKGQLTLSYDMTFLVMLLSGLYEPKNIDVMRHCIAHPIGRKHREKSNCITDYVADMNILLSYYKCMDDWTDDKNLAKLVFAGSLKHSLNKIRKKYPDKDRLIEEELKNLGELEKAGETSIDKPAACFGRILGEICVFREDEWAEALRRFGNSLGRFIYIMDAYDDLEKDEKKHSYNVLQSRRNMPDFDTFCERVMSSYMAQSARELEMLPIIENAEILRNIIYSGVWCRFNVVKKKREANNSEESKQ